MPPTDLTVLCRRAVGAVSGWGAVAVPALPEPLRDALRDSLPQLLVTAADRETYLGQLAAARREPGLARALNAATDGVRVPTDELLQNGIVCLTDEQLGALAVDPIRLGSLADLIREIDDLPGVWLDELSRAGAATGRPPLALSDELSAAIAAGGTVYPGRAHVRPSAPSGRRNRQLLALVLTAVVFGLVLGLWTAVTVAGPSGLLTVDSTVSRQHILGQDDVYALAVRCPADGFVTVVLLPPDGPPLSVRPIPGAPSVLTDGGRAVVDNLAGKSGTRLVAFVTPTPTTERIRQVADSLAAENLTPDAVVAAVTAALRADRHPWVGVTAVRTIP